MAKHPHTDHTVKQFKASQVATEEQVQDADQRAQHLENLYKTWKAATPSYFAKQFKSSSDMYYVAYFLQTYAQREIKDWLTASKIDHKLNQKNSHNAISLSAASALFNTHYTGNNKHQQRFVKETKPNNTLLTYIEETNPSSLDATQLNAVFKEMYSTDSQAKAELNTDIPEVMQKLLFLRSVQNVANAYDHENSIVTIDDAISYYRNQISQNSYMKTKFGQQVMSALDTLPFVRNHCTVSVIRKHDESNDVGS